MPKIARFIHGFVAKSRMFFPNASSKTKASPTYVNTMPAEKISASRIARPWEMCLRLVKKLTVIGIIGKTQGVTSEIAPATAAAQRNASRPLDDEVFPAVGAAGAALLIITSAERGTSFSE